MCVRKRPVLGSLGEEVSDANFDCISCCNPCTYLHGKAEKLGLFTGELAADRKEFDHTFGAGDDNAAVYRGVVRPLVDEVLAGGTCTVLYGTFWLNFHRFDRFELDLRGHTQP